MIVGCRLITKSNELVEYGNASLSPTSSTVTPKDRRFRRAPATFGGHDSVAANVLGGIRQRFVVADFVDCDP
jgi:hypothetical protein